MILLFCLCFFHVRGNEVSRGIVIGAQIHNPPYSFLNDEGHIDGFSVDITKALMAVMKKDYSIVQGTLNENIDMLENGETDMIMSILFTAERGEKFIFSSGYIDYKHDLVSPKESVIRDIDGISGKRVVVKEGGVAYDYLLETGIVVPDDIITLNDMSLGLKLIAEGGADVALIGNAMTRDIIARERLSGLELVKIDFRSYEFCMASANASLIRSVNNALNTIRADGTYDKIYYKWFGVRDTSELITRYIRLAFFSFLIIAALFILHTVITRRKIRRALAAGRLSDERIIELNRSISALLKDSDIDVYMFDEINRRLYIFRDGDYRPAGLDIAQMSLTIHPDDRDDFVRDYKEILSGTTDKVISRLRMFNPELGKYEYFEHIVTPVKKNASGIVVKFIFTKRNCTAQSEDLVNKNEIIHNMRLAIKAGRLLRWTYDIRKHSGRIIDDNNTEYVYSGNNNLNFILPRERYDFTRFINRLITKRSDESSIELNIRLDEGEYVLYELTAMVDYDNDEPKALYGILKDITESRNQKYQIMELQKRITMAMEAGDMSAWLYNCKSKSYTIIKGAAVFSDMEATRESYNSRVHSDDLKRVNQAMDNVISGLMEKATVQYRINTSYGWRWMTSCFTSIDDSRHVRWITGIVRDITEEMEAKEILEQQNRKLLMESSLAQSKEAHMRKMLDKLPIPIYIKDINSLCFTYMNEEAIRLFDFTPGSNIADYVPDSDTMRQWMVDNYVFDTGEEYTCNETLSFHDGRVLNTFVKKLLFDNDGQKQILTIRINLTDQVKSLRESKILSFSLPALKCYTWYLDSRENVIHYGFYNNSTQRNINELDTLNKFGEYVHPDDRENLVKSVREFSKNESAETSFSFRIDLERIGQYEWWESHAAVETIKDGDTTYKWLYGITINIQKRKNAENELIRLNAKKQLILDNISSGIMFINPDFTIQWSNMSDIFGPINGNMFKVGDICYEGYGLDRPCGHCLIFEAMLKNKICQYVDERTPGKKYNVEYIPVTDDTGVVQGIVMKVDDMTEHLALVENLKGINEELIRARDKAEISEKLKMAFLANMSHEIRTPLNAIVGFSELLQTCDDEIEKQEYMTIINNNNELLLRLVNDILDLSKIESGTIEIKNEKFDIVELFNASFAHFHGKCGPNISLSQRCTLKRCIVELDKSRVSQIYANFVSNAMKYTREGEVIMGLDYVDNGLMIYVEDTGIGIDEDKKHLIFRRFEKLDTFAQGTGLGLAITKAIVETLGGKIGFDSEKNVGSRFWAWLPCEAEISRAADLHALTAKN